MVFPFVLPFVFGGSYFLTICRKHTSRGDRALAYLPYFPAPYIHRGAGGSMGSKQGGRTSCFPFGKYGKYGKYGK